MEICDAHNDFLTEVENVQKRGEIVENFVLQGVKILCCAVFTTEQTLKIEDVERFAKEVGEYNQNYLSKCQFLLTIEDIGFVKTQSDLNRLIKLKPFAVTLTWNKSNQFAGGAMDKGGLTCLGKKVVKILEKHNILIDTAHMNKKTFWQFVKISSKPIFCSHANIYEMYKHKRNLTSKQVEYIVKSGGFLGLTLYQDFISKRKIMSKDIANQFCYLIKKFGDKNFGFGTDFFGISRNKLPLDVESYCDFCKIEHALKSNMQTKPTISNVMWQNFARFAQKMQCGL